MQCNQTQVKSSQQVYRADVDGLRAIAVLAVVLFHLEASQFGGGFVGVDVFFVISGFLITNLIWHEINDDTFSFTRFYERRIRRIVPALFAVLLLTMPFVIAYYPPLAMVKVAESMLATIGSAANFYFQAHTDYFNAQHSYQPFLHAWSLAVEEQFYFIFPVYLLFVSRRCKKQAGKITASLALLSFAIGFYLLAEHSAGAYYLPFSRAWELLMGALIALYQPVIRWSWLREISAAIGLIAILFSAHSFSVQTPFPGVAALLPTLGTALVIVAGIRNESVPSTSLVGRLLSSRILVGLGLISYSLYLIHWPLIVLQKLLILPDFDNAYLYAIHRLHIAVDLALCIALAIIFYFAIERPFRIGRFKSWPQRKLYRWAAAAAALSLLVALLPLAGHGLPARYTAQQLQIAAYLDYPVAEKLNNGICNVPRLEPASWVDDPSPTLEANHCLKPRNNRAHVLIVGDSHAAALYQGLPQAAPNVQVDLIAMWACPALYSPRLWPSCQKLSQYIYEKLEKNPVDLLILDSRWMDDQLDSLGATVAWAKTHKIPVLVIGPLPEYDNALPILLLSPRYQRDPAILQQHRLPWNLAMDRTMHQKANAEWHVDYFSSYDALCNEQNCRLFADDANSVPLYFDGNHLTDVAARRLSDQIVARYFHFASH